MTTKGKIGKPLSLTISALMITSLVAVLFLMTAGTVAAQEVDEWGDAGEAYVDNVLYVDNDWVSSGNVPAGLTLNDNAFENIQDAIDKADSTENNTIEVATGTSPKT